MELREISKVPGTLPLCGTVLSTSHDKYTIGHLHGRLTTFERGSFGFFSQEKLQAVRIRNFRGHQKMNLSKTGNCQNLKMSEFERVRIHTIGGT